MTRDEAILTAARYAKENDFPWVGPVFAGRQWIWWRCWFRWIVTAPAPTQVCSVVVMLSDRTGAVEEMSIVSHVYAPPRHPPSFFDFYPRPLWYQFLFAPIQLLLSSALMLSDAFSWVEGKYRLSRIPKCPRCGAKLRTEIAEQCPACHLEWHGKPMPRG